MLTANSVLLRTIVCLLMHTAPSLSYHRAYNLPQSWNFRMIGSYHRGHVGRRGTKRFPVAAWGNPPLGWVETMH